IILNYGSSLAAANIIRALSVPKVVSLPLISHLFETSNSSAQSSAVCCECFFFFHFQCKRSQFPYIVNKMNCDTQVIVISDWRPVVTIKGDAGSLFEELNFSCSLAVIQRQIVRIVPCSNSNHLRQPTVLNYVDGPTVTRNLNCYSVGNLFTDWSS